VLSESAVREAMGFAAAGDEDDDLYS